MHIPRAQTKPRQRVSRAPIYVGNKSDSDERFYFSDAERSTHLHVVGASNTGKSRFLEHLICQDIRAGRGVCLIDPHGTLYDRVVRWAAFNRVDSERLHLLQPARRGWTFGFNPLAFGSADQVQREFGVDTVVAATAQVWDSEDLNQTPRLARNLTLVYGALADLKLTIPDARYLLVAHDTDGARANLIARIKNPILRRAWEEIAAYPARLFNEHFESVRNRLNQFLHSEVVSSILSQQELAFDTQALMNEGGVLLVDLSKHDDRFSRRNARLLGSLIVNDLFNKASSRRNPEIPFHLYIDECYHFLTSDIEDILDEARKYGLHLTLAHQHLSQLGTKDSTMYGAVMSGGQTKVVFQLTKMTDAEEMAVERMGSEIDLQRVKEQITTKQVVGYKRTKLKNQSDSTGRSKALGRARTNTRGHNDTVASAWGTVEQVGGVASEGGSETTNPDGDVINTTTNDSQSLNWSRADSSSGSHVRTEGKSKSDQESQTDTNSSGRSKGTAETLEAILADSATQAYPLAEWRFMQARELNSLPRRHALIMRSADYDGPKVERMTTPDVYGITEHHGRRGTERFEERSLATSVHAIKHVEPPLPEAAEVISSSPVEADPQTKLSSEDFIPSSQKLRKGW